MDERPVSRHMPLLLVLFLGSGCAALIYEIVWFQLLEMVIGSSAVSLAVLLGTYMGGMGAGSLLLPRLVSPRRHPLRVYALLEAGIGLCGLAILFGMPAVVRVYSAVGGHGFLGLVGRGLVGAICLLLPTLLMGATLPAVSRWIETTPRGVSWLGLLYGGNTLGAVGGCLLAGFYLLRVHDMAVADVRRRRHQRRRRAPGLWAFAADFGAARPGFRIRSRRKLRPSRRNRHGLPRLDRDRSRPHRHRPVGLLRSGRRSRLDAAPLASPRRHGLHLFDHPGRLPGRAGPGQRSGLAPGPRPNQPSHASRVLPASADRRRSLGGLRRRRIPAPLARQSDDRRLRRPGLPDRPGPSALGGLPGRAPLGRQLPAGPGRGGRARTRPRPLGGQGLCRQHPGRHPRRRRLRHGHHPRDRDAPIPALDHRAGLRRRAHRPASSSPRRAHPAPRVGPGLCPAGRPRWPPPRFSSGPCPQYPGRSSPGAAPSPRGASRARPST